MASLIFAAGVLSYQEIKKQSAKHRAKKAQATTDFTTLEARNAARIAILQQQSGSCFCQRSDWRGGGCEHHGYVPAAGEPGGPPLYVEHEEDDGMNGSGGDDAPAYEPSTPAPVRRQTEPPPGYQDGSILSSGDRLPAAIPHTNHNDNSSIHSSGLSESRSTSTNAPYHYRRGEEDGFLAEQPLATHSSANLRTTTMTQPSSSARAGGAPSSMNDEEVRRINEERRKRMRSGGFANFRLRWKRDKGAKGKGDGVVR